MSKRQLPDLSEYEFNCYVSVIGIKPILTITDKNEAIGSHPLVKLSIERGFRLNQLFNVDAAIDAFECDPTLSDLVELLKVIEQAGWEYAEFSNRVNLL